MSIDDENKPKSKRSQGNTPDEPMEEGLENINSASGKASENVISNTHSERADKKHGRHNADPITGPNPKGI